MGFGQLSHKTLDDSSIHLTIEIALDIEGIFF